MNNYNKVNFIEQTTYFFIAYAKAYNQVLSLLASLIALETFLSTLLLLFCLCITANFWQWVSLLVWNSSFNFWHQKVQHILPTITQIGAEKAALHLGHVYYINDKIFKKKTYLPHQVKKKHDKFVQ